MTVDARRAASRPRPPRIFAALLVCIGLVLTGGGFYLAILGGSIYYLIAGAMVVASGLYLWRGRRRGAWLYGLMLVGTLFWALWEVGIDGWALMPRLLAPAVLGLWLLMPWTRRSLR